MIWDTDAHFNTIALWTALVIWVTIHLVNRHRSERLGKHSGSSQTQTQGTQAAPETPALFSARRQAAPETPEVTSARRRTVPRKPATEPIPVYNAHLELADDGRSHWLFYAVHWA